MHRARTGFVIVLLPMIAGVAFSGCGSSEAPPPPAADVAAIDPRFASPEAIVEYYNSLTTCNPVKVGASLDLFYAETELQRRYIAIVRSLAPVAELDYLMFDRFNELLDPNKQKRHMLSPDSPAVLTIREDSRAQGVFKDADGVEQTLYLVRIDRRWRVSGYTLEYNEGWTSQIADLDKFEPAMEKAGRAAQAVKRKLELGALTSAADVRTAFGEAIIRELDLE